MQQKAVLCFMNVCYILSSLHRKYKKKIRILTFLLTQNMIWLDTVIYEIIKAKGNILMKKRIALLLAGSMAVMTLMSGCGQDSDTAGSAESEEETIDAATLLESTDYDVTDYVTLMDGYMNLEVELDSDYEVTEEAVNDYIENSVLPYYPIYTKGDKTTVESGDVVNIDYTGTMDGEEFDGGSATGYNLTIGSGTFIDGFEDGLIGAEVGDSLDLELTFPEDYSVEDMAGQDVVFHVTVNGIMDETEATLDNIDDDYVEENFSGYGLSTVDELNTYFTSVLTSEYESEMQADLQTKVMEQLVDGCTVELPDGLLEERTQQVIAQTQTAADEAGYTFEEYISAYYGYSTEEDFEAYVSDTLEEQLVQELILEAIVEDQDISISTSDFDDFVSYYVSYYGFDDADAFYDTYGGEDFVQLSYAENVAYQNVMDAATTTVAEETEE